MAPRRLAVFCAFVRRNVRGCQKLEQRSSKGFCVGFYRFARFRPISCPGLWASRSAILFGEGGEQSFAPPLCVSGRRTREVAKLMGGMWSSAYCRTSRPCKNYCSWSLCRHVACAPSGQQCYGAVAERSGASAVRFDPHVDGTMKHP